MEKILGNEKQQNPFNEEQQVEVVVKTPIVHLIPEDPETLKTNIRNLEREIALALEKEDQFNATVRDYGNITLKDLPVEDQALIQGLSGKQEKLAAYKAAYKKRNGKIVPLVKKVLETTRKTMKKVAGIFPSF